MDLAFDPVAAAKTYAGMDTEELIRIAYLEPDYVPEAKAYWWGSPFGWSSDPPHMQLALTMRSSPLLLVARLAKAMRFCSRLRADVSLETRDSPSCFSEELE